MPRPVAWVIALIATILVVTLAFTSFVHPLDRYRSDGAGGLVRQSAECPAPFATILLGSAPANPNDEVTCHLASRTLLFEAGFVAVVGLLATWVPLTRRRPDSIEPISHKIRSERTID